MIKFNQRFSALIVISVVLVLLSFIPANSKMNNEDIKRLKSASLNCDIVAFERFMPLYTSSKISEFEDHIKHLNELKESIFNKAKSKFGPEVKRTTKGISIPISGKDPRWIKIFGPQWENIAKAHPEGPFHFDINLFMDWEQECDIIQRFQACLEDESFCTEYHVEGSVIHMVKRGEDWKIIYDLPADKEKQANILKSMIIEWAKWADNYLYRHKDTAPTEDFKFQFASDYSNRLTQDFIKLNQN